VLLPYTFVDSSVHDQLKLTVIELTAHVHCSVSEAGSYLFGCSASSWRPVTYCLQEKGICTIGVRLPY
jgi:hypothetical protein